MLIEDGSQWDLDREAVVTMEEEDGSGNVGYWSVMEMDASKLWLRQRDERAAECTAIVEEGNSGMEQETTAGHV
ncbi:hypothetical protein BHE74_00046241 [Ensete ventricosum]|nr:hypothetical protein GW17_00054514 [Ensete ventricosum]RWW47738.1 hypothetical protein BHE74_00046241 [Ensete ventricosum]RZR87031.1 hypothetical protein BHM03_00014340 [Ensete ventricosum]